MMRRQLTKPFFQKTLLLCLGIIVALVIAEVGLRVSGITYPVFDAYDHDRAIALKPDKEGWYHGEGKAYLKINSLGYRDIEHRKQKPPGVFRIAVLGDSFTEARQVDIAATFWKRLEAHLQGRPEFSNRRVEVLNFGIGGYGPTQEFLTLKKHVLDFSPDLVILAFCPGNDLSSNSKQIVSQVNRSFTPFYVLRDGQLVLDNSFRDLSIDYLQRRFLLASIHYSRILEIVNQARRVVVLRAMQQQPNKSYEIGLLDEEFLEPKDEVWKEAWRVNDAILAEMNKEVLQAGARFVLVTLTTPIQVDPNVAKREQLQRSLGVSDLFYTERRLRQLGQMLGFPVITLAERLQHAATQSGEYLHGFENSGMGTGHWNERGHHLVAEILAEEIPGILKRPVDRANAGK
jgi:hypothetical protein